MGRVILCTGQKAKIPYYFAEPGVNVYCIEELCYVLTQNAFLLDSELLSGELVEWIEKECALPQLAKRLYPYLNAKGSPEAFVSEILIFTGLYDDEVIARTENAMKMGESLTVYEKRKKRADAFLEKEKYETALLEYDKLLEELPEGERALSAKIRHNRGVALAGMFSFGRAADSFEASYELYPDEETYLHFLAAKRLELPEADYITFIADREEKYRLSMELEHKIEEAMSEYTQGEGREYLEQMKEWRSGEEAGRYYAATEKTARRLKEIYRSQVAK